MYLTIWCSTFQFAITSTESILTTSLLKVRIVSLCVASSSPALAGRLVKVTVHVWEQIKYGTSLLAQSWQSANYYYHPHIRILSSYWHLTLIYSLLLNASVAFRPSYFKNIHSHAQTGSAGRVSDKTYVRLPDEYPLWRTKFDHVILTPVGFCVISLWSFSWFLSNDKEVLLQWLLHFHDKFQLSGFNL